MKNAIVNIMDKFIFRNGDQLMESKKKEVLKIYPASQHGEITKVFDDIWIVKGQTKMPMLIPPMKISRTMTIIRSSGSGELTLIT